MPRRRKPMLFEHIDVIDIGHRGKCIGRTSEGEIVHVKNAVPGDQVKGIARRKKKGMWEADVREILKPSPHRQIPRCQHFEDCGGCKWQHFQLDQQHIFKTKQVHDAMRRIGGITSYDAFNIVASEKEFEYRNKMEFSFSNRIWVNDIEKDKEKVNNLHGGLGLHPPGWYSKVVDLETCHLIPDYINEIRNFIRDKSIELKLSFYDNFNRSGDMRSLVVKNNRKGDVMLVFVFGEEINAVHTTLMEKTIEQFNRVKSVFSILNQKPNDSLFDLDANHHFGTEYIEEFIGETKFRIGPKSFFQTNIFQTEYLYAEVERLANLSGEEVIYDLYSGIGSIGLFLAKHAKEIIAVEDVAEAVADAQMNAELNEVRHVTYYTGKMELLIEQNALDQIPKPDVIITDPPRAGMHEKVIDFILAANPQKIVYVSCDPGTMARDIKRLTEGHRYNLESVKPFDMFPHTAHIESVALLVNRINET